MSKWIPTSKTFWLAVIQAAAGVVMIFSGAYPEVGWIAVAKSVVDVLLRLITHTPVHLA